MDAIASKYNCNICLKMLRNAQLTVCCGQHYCHTCLEQWLSSKLQRAAKTCPHCREEDFQSFPNKAMMREINEFGIHCIHKSKGCEWVGELGDLNDHLESDKGCGYVTVKCTYHGYISRLAWTGVRLELQSERTECNAAMERHNVMKHQENECLYRQYTCQYCGIVDTYDSIAGSGNVRNEPGFDSENHYSECVNYPLDYPNECGERGIQRKDMFKHQHTCPLEILQCPLSPLVKESFICEGIQRKDMEQHVREECPFCPYKCEYCGHEGTYRSITGGKERVSSHYGKCTLYALTCPNECGRKYIQRKDMKTHLDTCPLEPLQCPMTQCHRRLPCRAIEKHIKEECPYRPYKCEYCSQEGTYISITGRTEHGTIIPSHYNECQLYPLTCPNQCGEEHIKRRDVKTHRSSCPLEPLECPFQQMGCCVENIQRRDLDSHCQQHM